MALYLANGLQGTDGQPVTLASLSATGDAPLDVVPTNLVYSDDYQIRGRNSIRMRTDYTRNSSGRFAFALPTGGPWTVRFYIRPLPLTEPYDISEYRYMIRFGNSVLVLRESTARNVVTRLADNTNLSTTPTQGTETGSAVNFTQVLRYEITYDSGTLTARVFPGNSTTGARQNVWSVNLDAVDQFTLSSWRWYRFAQLQQGSTDANTGGLVTPFQEKILLWDPNALPQFGADGDYGGETTSAVAAFQSQVGLPANGVANAETQTALDLAARLAVDPDDYPPEFWIGNLAVTDTADMIGPLDPHTTEAEEAVVLFSGEAEAEETTVAAHGSFGVQADIETISNHTDEALDSAAFEGSLEVFSTHEVEGDGTVAFGGSVTISGQSFIPEPPLSPPQFELAVYDPNGSLRGTLPFPTAWTASFPLNDVGSMQFTISARAPGADLLVAPFEIAIRLRRAEDEGGYVEPPQGRFISLRRQRDWRDRAETYTWTLANYGWMLRKARMRILPATALERKFTNARAGAILSTFAIESEMRFGGIARTFTPTQDSLGRNWNDSQTITYSYGVDYLTVVNGFAEEGILHWRFNQRSWETFRGDLEMHNARSVLIPAEDGILEAHDIYSFEDIGQRVRYIASIEIGNDPEVRRTIQGSVSDINNLPGWGLWEDMITIPGGTNSTAASQMAFARLRQIYAPKTQVDRRFLIQPYKPVPMLDYFPGSIVTVEDADERTYDADATYPFFEPWTTRESRIEQITLDYGRERGMEAVVSLNNRFTTREVNTSRFMRQSNATANAVWGSRVTRPF